MHMPSPTLHVILLAATLTGLAACTPKPEERLVGKWGANVEATMATAEFKALPEAQQSAARKGLEMFSASLVEFRADGKFKVEVPGMTEEGDWSIVKVEGDKLTVHSVRTKDGKSKDFPAVVTSQGLELTLFGNQPVHFVRK